MEDTESTGELVRDVAFSFRCDADCGTIYVTKIVDVLAAVRISCATSGVTIKSRR